uniref:Uncharacterized protein n=1 Tax=Panagrolaimus superbus TaxID=310955 RepID=A0A914YRY2_9BILA
MDLNKSSHDQHHEVADKRNDQKSKLDEMAAKFDDKISILEKKYVENCEEILQNIAPNYMYSQNFDKFLTENLQFPSLDKICEMIKKRPREIFERIPGIEIQAAGFSHWLSLESKQPSFRRQKLDDKGFLECIDFAEPDLKNYTEEDEKDDEEMIKYLDLRYGSVFDNIADEIHDIKLAEEDEKKKKAQLKKGWNASKRFVAPGMEEEEIVQKVAPLIIRVDRMKIFRDIFDIDKRSLVSKILPPATQFVGNEPAMAKLFPLNETIYGTVVPDELPYHLELDHIINVLKRKKIYSLNEFQRLVVHLIQYPFMRKVPMMPLSNLLICAEQFHGFQTVLAPVLIKLVVEYKELNEYGEAPRELRFNRNPYILIVALNESDCLPLYQAFQPYLKGCQISVPPSGLTNVKLQQNLLHGCDIFLSDRRKLEFIRNGEIDLCNLRHVIFLDIDRFIDGNESLISDVHKYVQLALEKKRYDSGKKVSAKENFDVQYIFQTYKEFTNWNYFDQLLYRTQPVRDNLALILPYDYNAYNLNQK